VERPPSIQDLRKRLEERRRRTLGMVKALDRLGVEKSRLGRTQRKRYAEADRECLVWLFWLAKKDPKEPAPAGWEQVKDLEEVLEKVEEEWLRNLPPTQRRAVQEAHQVGMLMVEEDEIYEGIPRPRRE